MLDRPSARFLHPQINIFWVCAVIGPGSDSRAEYSSEGRKWAAERLRRSNTAGPASSMLITVKPEGLKMQLRQRLVGRKRSNNFRHGLIPKRIKSPCRTCRRLHVNSPRGAYEETNSGLLAATPSLPTQDRGAKSCTHRRIRRMMRGRIAITCPGVCARRKRATHRCAAVQIRNGSARQGCF